MPKRASSFRVGRVLVRARRGPNDAGEWYWRADRPDGKGGRVDVWLGWATRDEAESEVMRRALAADPLAATEDGAIVTVKDLVNCWLHDQRQREDIAPSTKAFSAAAAQRLIDAEIRHVRVDRLDSAALDRHRDSEIRRGAATSTVARDLKVLRQAWRWARQRGHVEARDLPTVKIARHKPRYTRYTPTRDEVARILAALATGPRPWVRLAVVLLSSTGARIGEVAGLTWGRVADDCHTVAYVGKTSTESEPRTVPLHPQVARALLGWRDEQADIGPDDWVLGVSPTTARARVWAELSRVSRELGLGGKVSANGLRRHVTDALYDAGQTPDVESALLGHSPEVAMAIYRRVRAERAQAAVVAAGLGIAGEPDVYDLDEEREKRGR